MERELAIVMATCYKYRDTWHPFFTLFEKYWPNCKLKKYVVADCSVNAPSDWIVIQSKPETSWCKTVLNGLDCIQQRSVLLLQDDFFINAPVREDLVKISVEHMNEVGANALRIYPCPGPDEECEGNFGVLSKNADYRVSCQATIWDRAILRIMMMRFETPMQFELEGTMWARKLTLDLLGWRRDSVPWPISYICTAIVRGCWTKSAIEFCTEEGIPLDTSLRPIGEIG